MKTVITLFIFMFSLATFAQDAVIAVGNAEQDKDKLVIDDPEMKSLGGTQKALVTELMDILRNVDSELMEELEPCMPNIDKVLIIPEGAAEKAVIRSPHNHSHIQGFNQEYVKEI